VKQNWTEYFVTEKTDGVRHLIYFGKVLGQQVQALIHRNLKVSLVKFEVPQSIYKGTVLDGEWIGDKFLVFDIVSSFGLVSRYLPFTDRLKIIKKMIPFLSQTQYSPFTFQAKRFVPIQQLPTYVERWCSLGHSSDGFIFVYNSQCLMDTTDPTLLKWKPPELQTIDFYLKVGEDVQFYVYNDKSAYLFTTQPLNTIPTKLDASKMNGIWECKYIHPYWIPVKSRADKTFPNSLYVAKKTWQHILDNITIATMWDYWFPNQSVPTLKFSSV